MEKVLTVKIDKTLDGKIVKYVLLDYMKLSKTLVKNLKKTDDGILLNGERVNVLKTVKEGDVLALTAHDKENFIVPNNIELDILYEDEDIIVLNKPAGMPTHPSRNHFDDTLANALMYYFKDKNLTFHAITRLDRETSGIVLVAKNVYSAQRLSKSMEEKNIKKEYVAVLNGIPKEKDGVVNAPIKRKKEGEIPRCVSPDGKEAITKYTVLDENGKTSLVHLFPVTGRTHQIRVHMSYIGNPIYGDVMYGAMQEGERTRLHCLKISFKHPITERQMEITAPYPKDIKEAVLKIF